MAESQLETSDESFNDGIGGQETDKKDGSNVSLERKDSLKLKTMKKHGHLRVKEDGQLTYKRTPSSALMLAIQLGIGYSVGRLTAKQERDILMQDFSFVEKVWFPSSGSRETPSHRFQDFKFKSYAPSAFRYFRDLFGMQPSEFLMALSIEELRELSNPGASGSLIFLSADDNFLIKTVQHKEATFLQQLLPGYYMNIHQNPRTLLPKFFGLYCYQSQNVNIRLVVMNNILKTTSFRCHQLYDLKGSTFKRKASKAELGKKTPTKKDLDFRNDYSEGITLEANLYDAVIKTIKRDCRVLESFKIMDYSLLLGIHNMDQAEREKENARTDKSGTEEENPERIARREEFGAALEAIEIDKEGRPLGGIPATSPKGDRLILYIGIIDILQSYRIGKKLEHGWKSLIHDGDSVSVHNPSFYAKRFISFMADKVFKKGPPAGSRGNAKRRSNRNRTGGNESFIDPAPSYDSAAQKSKEGKQKATSVKFSEQAIVYDSDSQEQMVPPPYEAQASLTQKEAGPSTSQAGEGAQGDVVKTDVNAESAAEGSNVATETESDTTPVVVEVYTTSDKSGGQAGVAMDTSNEAEITVEDYLAQREAAAQLQDGSHVAVSNGLESRDLDQVEVVASCVTNTVTYSNSVTVVTSTISYETVPSRSDGKEAVTRVTYSKWSERDDGPGEFSNSDEATREDAEFEGRNGLNHIHTEVMGVKGDSSEGSLLSKGSDVVESKDVQVTNIDTIISESVGPIDVKLELPPNTDSYEVNGVMVTKI